MDSNGMYVRLQVCMQTRYHMLISNNNKLQSHKDAASGAFLFVLGRLQEPEVEPMTFVSLERPQMKNCLGIDFG